MSKRIPPILAALVAASLSPVFFVEAFDSRQQPPSGGFPSPFERFTDQDLKRVVYPGNETPPGLHTAAVWKEPGTPRLLTIFDRPDRHYEIVELGTESDRLVVTARFVEPDRWDDAHGFDLAPYRITKELRAMGVRYQTTVPGGTRVVLVLYLRAGATFERIFERPVEYQAMESDDFSRAEIQIVAGKGEYNDLRVIDRGSRRTVGERWTWDSASRTYREVRPRSQRFVNLAGDR